MEKPYSLGCNEVWGRNREVARTVALSGLVAWVYSSPLRTHSGGDLHYLSVRDYGVFSRVLSRVLLADVMGHGESVSHVATDLHAMMHKHINTWDQSELMRELNRSFHGGVPGFNYATLVILGYNSTNRQLVITDAGHPPPLWYRAAAREWSWLEDDHTSSGDNPEDLPVGMIPGTDYRQSVISFTLSDKIILYTDGITDAENSSGEPLGRDRLQEWARLLPGNTPDETGRALLDRLRTFRSGPPTDDESLVVLQAVTG